jgi:hypothetical protein
VDQASTPGRRTMKLATLIGRPTATSEDADERELRGAR